MTDSGQEPPSVADIAIRAALSAVPQFGGSLVSVYEGIRDRRAARANEVVAEAAGVDELLLLTQRLQENEELDAALSAAVEAGVRSSLEAKRRLLGRIVRAAVLDDAKVDEATLLIGVLAQIDAPHVRCLEALRRVEETEGAAGRIRDRARGAERETNQAIYEVGLAHPAPVVIALKNLGLLEGSGTYDMQLVQGLTPFGRRLAADLRAAEDPA